MSGKTLLFFVWLLKTDPVPAVQRSDESLACRMWEIWQITDCKQTWQAARFSLDRVEAKKKKKIKSLPLDATLILNLIW